MKTAATVLALLVIGAAASACTTSGSGGPAPTTAEAQTADSQVLICRETLTFASNTLRRVCRTAEDWERHERREAAAAQAMTQRLQGSSYSGGY